MKPIFERADEEVYEPLLSLKRQVNVAFGAVGGNQPIPDGAWE